MMCYGSRGLIVPEVDLKIHSFLSFLGQLPGLFLPPLPLSLCFLHSAVLPEVEVVYGMHLCAHLAAELCYFPLYS